MFSVVAQATAFLAYEVSRPTPVPKLTVRLVPDGYFGIRGRIVIDGRSFEIRQFILP